MEKLEFSHTAGGNALKFSAAMLENTAIPQEVKHWVMHPQFHFQVYVQGNENICAHKNLHRMFTAALFIIAKKRKQPKCPSTGEWINKV